MNRPPRDPQKPLFGSHIVGLSLLQGVGALAVVLAVFSTALYRGLNEDETRALTFTSLVLANLALISTNRSWVTGFIGILRRPNAAIGWVMGGAVLFLTLVLYLPFLRNLFQFAVLRPADLGICLSASITSLLWFELLKMIRNRRLRSVKPL
jgi:Ca2+-transporting ATPase